MRWQLQDAKARLSELIEKATTEGPQEITVRGEPAVVVVSRAEFDKLTGKDKKPNLVEFLLASPLAGSGIEIEREKDSTQRDLDLFKDET